MAQAQGNLRKEVDLALSPNAAAAKAAEEARAEFAEIDANNDGVISPEEYAAYKSKTPTPAPAEIDANQDGGVPPAEDAIHEPGGDAPAAEKPVEDGPADVAVP